MCSCATIAVSVTDRKAMRQLEEAEKALKDKRLRVETTGRVLRVVTEPTGAIAA
jgi:hypothetical protein